MTTAPTRRGTIYILVLVSAVIVTLIGVIGLRLAHTQAAVARADAQRDEAMCLAESAVQWGIHYVMLGTDWRDDTTSGATIRTMPLGEGTISITITDPDGDLDNGDSDPFIITGTGTVGDATQSLAVTIANGTGGPHPALEDSITVGGVLSLNPGSLWVESGGTAADQTRLDGTPLTPPLVSEASPVDLPNPDLIQTWIAKGTVIGSDLHKGTITGQTFSKSLAPYGSPLNAQGIYVIDADGKAVTLNNVNSTGTLIVADLQGAELTIINSRFNVDSFGGPALLVDGDADYEPGPNPGLTTGTYFINGDFELGSNIIHFGTIMVTGDVMVDAQSAVILDYGTDVGPVLAGPPEGFVESTGPSILPGSWTRLVN